MTLNNEATKAQKALILDRLQNGGTITALDALQPPIRCLRLPSRIWDLKQDGHAITKEMVTVESGKRVARYKLLKAA